MHAFILLSSLSMAFSLSVGSINDTTNDCIILQTLTITRSILCQVQYSTYLPCVTLYHNSHTPVNNAVIYTFLHQTLNFHHNQPNFEHQYQRYDSITTSEVHQILFPRILPHIPATTPISHSLANQHNSITQP